MAKTISFTAPDLLRMEIEASSDTGYYDNKSEFLRDATRTLLAARKDLRISIASELYKKGKISLGRAVEIADVNYEEMKKLLVERGIKITRGSRTVEEMKKRARKIGA
jgi:predicted HTH domain antitoxin